MHVTHYGSVKSRVVGARADLEAVQRLTLRLTSTARLVAQAHASELTRDPPEQRTLW